jgi:hypothetical protein
MSSERSIGSMDSSITTDFPKALQNISFKGVPNPNPKSKDTSIDSRYSQSQNNSRDQVRVRIRVRVKVDRH